ncbi:MAG: class I SAM-dependent methyltransferase, partial [Desulfobulbaceae bacterium]|nr:class I SAM-dependent methyltransferase [Desulfobulbaceae bacterium]
MAHISEENQSVQNQEDKYTRKAVLIPSKVRKGKTRWNQCVEELVKINSHLLQGPVLDFGCGGGYFVLEGLRRDLDIWGVDQLVGKIKRYRKLVEYTSSPKGWEQRCLVGDGRVLPFPSDYFDFVSSWWVFEHIP